MIFFLIGMVVGSVVAVSAHIKRSRQSARLDAAKAIHARLLTYPNPPQSKIPPHTVAVPFSDGTFAYVVDCAQVISAAKGDIFDKTNTENELTMLLERLVTPNPHIAQNMHREVHRLPFTPC